MYAIKDFFIELKNQRDSYQYLCQDAYVIATSLGEIFVQTWVSTAGRRQVCDLDGGKSVTGGPDGGKLVT